LVIEARTARDIRRPPSGWSGRGPQQPGALGQREPQPDPLGLIEAAPQAVRLIGGEGVGEAGPADRASVADAPCRAVSVQGPFKVECGELFPHRLGVVGEVTPLDDFDKSSRENRVQARDKDSGLPLWQVEVLDFDQQAREKTFKVKIAAAVQPVPPEALQGAPVRPVVLEGLTVTPYIKDGNRPRIGYSLRRSGLAAPGRRSADPGKAA
jgi:hypothetical protein